MEIFLFIIQFSFSKRTPLSSLNFCVIYTKFLLLAGAIAIHLCFRVAKQQTRVNINCVMSCINPIISA